jgi:hypothetical protein
LHTTCRPLKDSRLAAQLRDEGDGAPGGFEDRVDACIQQVSGTYDACIVHVGAENLNDSIPIGPETGTVGNVAAGDPKRPHNPRGDFIAELSRGVEALALVGDTKGGAHSGVAAPCGSTLATERAAMCGKRGGQ